MKKVILITGVTGGIGSATAKMFFDSGWNVIGVDIAKKNDEIDCFIEGDVSNTDVWEDIFTKVGKNFGYIDLLVNNAAIQICKPLVKMTTEEWDSVLASNLRSVFLAVKYCYPLMCNRGAAIINICSVHALATSPNIAAYAASKGALLSLTRALALELAKDDIRVNAILPGAIDTPMLHAGFERNNKSNVNNTEGMIKEIGAKHILGRIGQPNEIAQGILFLADKEKSSFITGQSLVIDGGATARLSTE